MADDLPADPGGVQPAPGEVQPADRPPGDVAPGRTNPPPGEISTDRPAAPTTGLPTDAPTPPTPPAADVPAEPADPADPTDPALIDFGPDAVERPLVDFMVEPPAAAPADPAPASRGRNRIRRALLIGLLAVVGAGVAAAGTAAWRVSAEKDALLSTPAQVIGLGRDDSERAASTADYLRTALAAEVSVDESVAAVYTDPAAAGRSVLFFGGTTLLWRPEHDLDAVMALVAGETGQIAGLSEVPAGALGGVMKCGSTSTQDGEIAVCGWADHGSIAVAMFPGAKPEESAPQLRELRGVVQRRD